jgi:hypothetical protein
VAYYGVLFPEFWTGRTGREIRRLGGPNAQVLAVYLMSNRHANMIGLYRLSADDVSYETGLKPRGIEAGWKVLADVDFARYDPVTEHVWVLTMARFRLGLKAGEALQSGDRKVIAINKLYHGIDPNPFLGDFFATNHQALRIAKARTPQGIWPPTTTSRPFDGALDGASVPLGCQVQDQRSGSGDQDQGTDQQVQEKARLSPLASPVENLRVITRLVREIRQEHPDYGFADLKAAAKERCAVLQVAYDADVVGKAVDSALSKRLAHAH